MADTNFQTYIYVYIYIYIYIYAYTHTYVYRVIENPRNLVWYLVFARNECNAVELVDEYFGTTVQKQSRGKNR